jgi:organic hydroperoxide reductase OsmC/OhrA
VATPKRLEYAVEEESGSPPRAEPDWTAEHLLLAALARCSLKSLEFYGKRVNVRVSGRAGANGVVTRREDDGRYAFVETRVELDVRVDPPIEGEQLRDLLDRAEQGCFIGASLTASPRYEWRVNGEAISA